MSNGRHFNPPTPAYRPRDPFANFAPRSAERVPSCETTKPPPARARPVRMDSSSGIVPVVPMSLKVDPATVVPRSELDGGNEGAPQPAEPLAPPAPVVAEAAPAAVTLPPPPPPAPVVEAVPVKDAARPVHEEEAPARKRAPAAEKAPSRQAKADKHEKTERSAKADKYDKVEKAEKTGKTGKKAKAAEPARGKSGARSTKEAPARPAAKPARTKAEAELVAGEGEEVRICEWEKCGKKFVVQTGGRNVVRRFCSGTCRGRASEARTGKRA